MLLIYAVVILFSASIVFSILQYFPFNKIISALIVGVVIIIAVVITHICIAPQYNSWKMEKKLTSRYPVFELLAEKDPDNYKVFIAKLKSDMLAKSSQYNEFKDVGTFLNTEMVKYSQSASNESLYNFAKTILNFYNKLIDINPVYILNLEFPEKFGEKIDFPGLESASKDNTQEIILAKESIIRSAVDDPQPALDAEQVQQAQTIFRQIITELVNKYGKDVVLATFQHPEDDSTDQKTAATIIIQFYSKLVSRGETDAGIVLKYLFKAGAPKQQSN